MKLSEIRHPQKIHEAPARDAIVDLRWILRRFERLETVPVTDAMTQKGHIVEVEFEHALTDDEMEAHSGKEAIQRVITRELRKLGHRAKSVTVDHDGVSILLAR